MGIPRTASLVSIQVNNFSLPNYDDVILEHLLQDQKDTSSNLISMIYYVTLSHLFTYVSQSFYIKGIIICLLELILWLLTYIK